MMGREEKQENDLFYTCSLIDYIARKTKNKRSDVIDYLGKNTIEKIYNLADIYHSDNIDNISEEFIEKAHITDGNFDNIKNCKYNIPSYWDIGKVYKRLILGISKEKNLSIIDSIFEAYHSFVSDKIDDYNYKFKNILSSNKLQNFIN